MESDKQTPLAAGGWSRAAAIDRSRDKVESVIRWLGWFDYSDKETIADMLGVARNGQGAFFKKLEASGFITAEKAPGIRRVIYGLGDAGFEFAQMLLPELELKRRRRLPAWVSLIHSLSIQVAIINRLHDIQAIRPERTLKHLRAVRLPDAIITMNDGKMVALEVELNHKNTARVYNVFLSHLKNIHNENYQKVIFIFPNDALRRLYREKFDQPIWPIYRQRPGSTKLVLDEKNTFNATQLHDSELFEFRAEETYKL